MKIRDVLENFSIHASNEENALLASLNGPRAIEDFSEREQFILENLIRKSLVSKVYSKGSTLVLANEI